MNKAIFSLIGSFALLLSFAIQADTVYVFDSGDWHLRGYADVNNPSDNACVLNTQWNDGKKIQVNVFPQNNGSKNVTMTLLNPIWNNSSWSNGQSFSVRFDFLSGKYEPSTPTGEAQIYNREEIIFRGLNELFISNFIHYDSMTIFANTAQEWIVNLEGTAALSDNLDACVSTVLGSDGGNH